MSPKSVGVVVLAKELFKPPKFTVGDSVFATANSAFVYGAISEVCAWGHEWRFTIKDTKTNKIFMDKTNPLLPYKFDEANLQIWHPPGTPILILYGHDECLGVVKNILSEEQPLCCEITIINRIVQRSDGEWVVQTEDKLIPRSVYLKKVGHDFLNVA